MLRLAPSVKERMKVLSDVVPLSAFLFKDEPNQDKSAYIAKGMSEEQTAEAFKRGAEIILNNEKAGKPFSETESDIKKLAEDMGIKINGVFQPVRVGITASAVSLPLHDSIALLGLEETEKRINRALNLFN